MTLIGIVPILMALCLLFIPLLSDGPPGPPKRPPRRAIPKPPAISARQGCHLHGLPPQPNRIHPLEPS
jgi:hypothetical protein